MSQQFIVIDRDNTGRTIFNPEPTEEELMADDLDRPAPYDLGHGEF